MLNSIDHIPGLMADLFIILIGLAALALIAVYVIDRTQTRHAIRRNFPVFGRLRYLSERLGQYFRQYFYAQDREELPFNRAERSWVYRAAKNIDTTVPFGSTRDIKSEGTVLFVPTMFPVQEEDSTPAQSIIFGPYARQPYEIASFFNISAMSYGSISRPAVEALSRGAAKAGIWLNTGEGGLSAYHLSGGCDIVFQIGTAKYGVRDGHGHLDPVKLKQIAALQQVKMIELKLSQGAKPGKGGILPGIKVTPEIAAIRAIPVGLDSISPNRHPDINSVPDLLREINRLRDISGLPTGFKTVIGEVDWLHEMCRIIGSEGVEYAPDFITIDSADGGTGASPQPLIDYVGLPIGETLPAVIDCLDQYGLRPRIRVIVAGKLITPSGVAWALCHGADTVNSARGFMFALGCIQAMQCNKNTCPTGVTTHQPQLQRGLVPADKAERVAHYAKNMMKEVGAIAHSCGVTEPRLLTRRHARVVIDQNQSSALSALYPPVKANPR